MIRLTCIIFGHMWDGDECIACGADKWVLNTGYPRPNVSRETSTPPSPTRQTERNTMTTFIPMAARLYVEACEKGYLEPDMENDQLVAANDELEVIRTTPDNKHQRAERGRIAVELFGFQDDIETMAADVIGDIMHWVAREAGDGSAQHAHYRGARYYDEEAR